MNRLKQFWKNARDIILKSLIVIVVLYVTFLMINNNMGPKQEEELPPYNIFIEMLNKGEIRKVVLDKDKINFMTSSGQEMTVINPEDPKLVDDLLKNHVQFKATPYKPPSALLNIFISWFPMIILIGVWIWFMRKQGGRGGAFGMGQSKAKLLEEDKIKVTFADVAGCDEAKEDVTEMVDFLRDPSAFHDLGGKIPKGALLVGPPGTGKTLLARAVAGEAKVPFFTISGSDFVEMFVGVGASRVRDMFVQAKAKAPCIIFIDEIDAVGRHRGAGLGGGHDEREQTLNQLLVEMDGFDGNEGVIIFAATNRPDVLDPALLRPGRFDRQITVGLPDIKGREKILEVHVKDVKAAEDVDIAKLAMGTPGFSGADLENLVNEAAIFAARGKKSEVAMADFESAKDKILMGAERRSMVMSQEEKKMTAYHEAGHAIVGWFMPEHNPIYKVSIMPRGRALGITMFLPERDEWSKSKDKIEGEISSLYGGRIAEEILAGANKITTGASNDIERATALATKMVTEWGMSAKLKPIKYVEEKGENPFLGKAAGMGASVNARSAYIADLIDSEIESVIDRNYSRAEKVLRENMDKLHAMAQALIEKETIDKAEIEAIMA